MGDLQFIEVDLLGITSEQLMMEITTLLVSMEMGSDLAPARGQDQEKHLGSLLSSDRGRGMLQLELLERGEGSTLELLPPDWTILGEKSTQSTTTAKTLLHRPRTTISKG